MRAWHLIGVVLASAFGCGGTTEPRVEPVEADTAASDVRAPLPAVQTPLAFQADETRAPVLPDSGGGIGIADYDADGDLDIAIAIGANEPNLPPARLYQNDGTGHFTDVTEASGLGKGTSRLSAAVVFVDVDGDGILDLFITRRYASNLLFLGKGPGTFVNVSMAWGLTTKGVFDGACFADLDGDGDLDVHIATSRDPARDKDKWEQGENGAPDLVYRNDGDHFTDATDAFGLAGDPHGESYDAVAFDVDGDLLPDLFKDHDYRPDEFFKNDGGGRFHLEPSWLEDANTGLMGVDVGDIDGDGLLDLYATNFGHDHVKLQEPNYKYKRFVDMASQLWGDNPDPSGGLTGWGIALSDLDNDTDLDVITVAGYSDSAGMNRDGRLVLVENLGLGRSRGTLIDRSDTAGPPFDWSMHGLGLSTGDLDGDGDLDVVVGVEKVGPGADRPPGLIENSQILWNVGGGNVGHHAIELDLAMASSKNRFGVGAIVRVTVNGRVQTRVVLAGSSHLSSIGPRLHFGLGEATTADKIEVTWPDGGVSSGQNVPEGLIRIARP